MSAIVMRIVTARNGQFAYGVDFYKHGKRGDADPTETRRTGSYSVKHMAFKEAEQIRDEFRKESEH